MRGVRPAGAEGTCRDRHERTALVARVLADLGACTEARALGHESLECRPEPLPATAALDRAAELRRLGRAADAARSSARGVHAALSAGKRVRAIPMLSHAAGGVRLELTTLGNVLGAQWRAWQAWQSEPSVYFVAGATCVGATCLLPGGRKVQVPEAELLSGFAPRRFDYPWRTHPAQRLLADAFAITDAVTRRKLAFEVPAGVVPDRFTGMPLADVAFSRDGRSVWALSWSGRLFAVDTRTGRLVADFDLTRTCPRVQDPLRIVAAAAAEVAIAQVGTAPGCAHRVHRSRGTLSALPFAPGELLALSGNGRVAAVHRQGRVTSYDLEALAWLDPPPAPSFAAPEPSHLALSYDGSVIALVVPGRQVELPGGALEIWATELRLLQQNGVPVSGYEPWGLGFGSLVNGDFGARTFSLNNAIFDYRGRLRAVLLAQNESVLAVFADGTLEAFGPEARDLYRCAIDGARFPAEDCADLFERPGQLSALVDGPARGTDSARRQARGWVRALSARE